MQSSNAWGNVRNDNPGYRQRLLNCSRNWAIMIDKGGLHVMIALLSQCLFFTCAMYKHLGPGDLIVKGHIVFNIIQCVSYGIHTNVAWNWNDVAPSPCFSGYLDTHKFFKMQFCGILKSCLPHSNPHKDSWIFLNPHCHNLKTPLSRSDCEPPLFGKIH